MLSKDIIYASIAGSCSYRINIEKSDIDIIKSYKNTEYIIKRKYIENKKIDIFTIDQEMLYNRMIGNENIWYFSQILFPYKFLLNNELSQFIEENRERIIRAILPKVYSIYNYYIKNYEVSSILFYNNNFPDRLVKKFLLSGIIINYSKGMSFESAHKTEEKLREILLKMRKNEICLDDVVYINNIIDEQYNKDCVANFYKKSYDVQILEELKKVIVCIYTKDTD